MLEGWEWLIVGGVAIVIIMWGPGKIPEFARALGRAKGEFSKASQEFSDAALSSSNAPSASSIKSKDEILLDTAKNLGIATNGKTREEISEEIATKVKLMGSS